MSLPGWPDVEVSVISVDSWVELLIESLVFDELNRCFSNLCRFLGGASPRDLDNPFGTMEFQ